MHVHVYLNRTWAHEIEIFDMREYVHTAGFPLQAADIYSIAFEPTPAAAQTYFADAKCLQITDPNMEDKGWKDVFMNSCDWCKLCTRMSANAYAGRLFRCVRARRIAKIA